MKDFNLDQLIYLEQCNIAANKKFIDFQYMDAITHLSEKKQNGWCRLLASVATTESVEEVLIKPLEKSYSKCKKIVDYINSHKQDELRHHKLINRYLKNSFCYEKNSRTISDKIFYDNLYPKIAMSFKKKPIYGLSILLFFESYGIEFYKKCRIQAIKDCLPELVELIKNIEKDELRHLKGLEILFQYHWSIEGACSWYDKKIISNFLNLLVLDLNMSTWAWHNRSVRKHVLEIGLDPQYLTNNAHLSAKSVLKWISC